MEAWTHQQWRRLLWNRYVERLTSPALPFLILAVSSLIVLRGWTVN